METAMRMIRLKRITLTRSFVAAWIAFFGAAIEQAQAQLLLNPSPPPSPPVLNPSTPYTVPTQRQTPVAPNAPGALPGSGAELPTFGQDLRLTIISTDETDTAGTLGGDANKVGGDADKVSDEKQLDSIGAMYAALRNCWIPPAKDSARHGMEYTVRFAFGRDGEIIASPRVTYTTHDAPAGVRDVYRDAVNAALARCTPLHFSSRMRRAVAGRPIAIRFVDNRTIDQGKSLQ
jgi:hypothetical protein